MNETKQATLYDLTVQAQDVIAKIVESKGELSVELERTLAELDLNTASKIDGYNSLIERLEWEHDYFDYKISGLKKVSLAICKFRERLRDAIRAHMVALDKKEALGNDTRFVRSNCRPKLEVDDALLPMEWKTVVTTYVPDRERIEEALLGGVEIPGAHFTGGEALRSYARTSLNKKRDTKNELSKGEKI